MSLLPVNERNEMSEMGGMKPPGNFNPVGHRCPCCYSADFVGRRSHGHLSFVLMGDSGGQR